MPHLHLETTADLPENGAIPDILEALVAKLSEFESITSSAVKAYHTLRVNWAMGEGAAPGFAHLTIAILSGRPIELRKFIADGLWAELQAQFADSVAAGDAQLTLEVREMEPETYRKMVYLPGRNTV